MCAQGWITSVTTLSAHAAYGDRSSVHESVSSLHDALSSSDDEGPPLSLADLEGRKGGVNGAGLGRGGGPAAGGGGPFSSVGGGGGGNGVGQQRTLDAEVDGQERVGVRPLPP